MASFKETLAQAYHRSQVGGDQAGAIADLRAVLRDEKMKTAAHAELKRLDAFMRSMRGRRGCAISRTMHDLLVGAFQ